MRLAAARLLLLFTSLAGVGLAAELAFRALPRPDTPALDQELGWASPEALAFEAHERSAPGVQRVLFLGDSMIVPYGLRGAQRSIPQEVQVLAGESALVRTLASAGWGTDQELLAFALRGAAFRPDVVVLAFCPYNDLSNNLSTRLRVHQPGWNKPYFRLEEDELVLYESSGERAVPIDRRRAAWHEGSELAFRVSQAVQWLETKRDDPTTAAPDPRYEIFKRTPRPYREIHDPSGSLSWAPQETIDHFSAFIDGSSALNDYQWRLFEALLGELAARTDSIGSRLVLVLIPTPIPGFDQDPELVTGSGFRRRYQTPAGPVVLDLSHPGRRLAEIAKRQGVEFVDPSTRFLEALARGGPSLVRRVWPYPDPHFAGPANAMLAREIWPKLRSRP